MCTQGTLLLISLSFFGLSVQAADRMPPIGKRLYILEDDQPEKPAAIRPLGRGFRGPGQSTMRDPVPIGVNHHTEKSIVKAADSPKRISRMVFDKVPVQGRYLVPRVTFHRPTLNMGPEEEPIKVEYRKKILESERELHEFDW